MNPDDPQVLVVPPASVTISQIGQNAFRVEWAAVQGMDAYEITVALDDEFNDAVSPYIELRENSLGLNIINLASETQYFVQVRSVLGSEKSSFSSTVSATTLDGPTGEPQTALKDAATTFSVGMAVRSNRLNGQHGAVLEREYNQLTSEYEMKMNIMYPSQDNYDFSQADQIVDYAQANGMDVHGHALIWHSATPSWVENFGGTDEEFEIMIEDYIKTTVTRYIGKVRSWDVVNEAIADGTNDLRNTVFLRRMGPDYIAKCHRWAREADPDVLLFYNDYNMVSSPGKRAAALQMVDQLIADGVPVDGFGFQMHISYNGPSKSAIQSASQDVVNRNLLLHFSELDVRANPSGDLQTLTPDRAMAQQNKVEEVVEVYNAIPQDNKFALTIWGLKDNESWLLDFWGQIDWPLLYDNDFNIKKAHTGFLEGLE